MLKNSPAVSHVLRGCGQRIKTRRGNCPVSTRIASERTRGSAAKGTFSTPVPTSSSMPGKTALPRQNHLMHETLSSHPRLPEQTGPTERESSHSTILLVAWTVVEPVSTSLLVLEDEQCLLPFRVPESGYLLARGSWRRPRQAWLAAKTLLPMQILSASWITARFGMPPTH